MVTATLGVVPLIHAVYLYEGNRMDIRVRLPTRDLVLAEEFLKNPGIIVESTYDKSRLTKLSDTVWKIRFAEIPIPVSHTNIALLENLC